MGQMVKNGKTTVVLLCSIPCDFENSINSSKAWDLRLRLPNCFAA